MVKNVEESLPTGYSVFPKSLSALATSSSDAPRFILIFSSVGLMWFMLTRRLLTPLTDLGPVIKTKFLSIKSTMTHLFPFSRPVNLTQILPTSIAGKT
jgi:hypothetical protein